MENISESLKKSFATLREEERVSTLYQIIEDHNLDLRNTKFLDLKAPPRVNTRFRRSSLFCKCGHEYCSHALDEDWEDGGCRMCKCEKFEGK